MRFKFFSSKLFTVLSLLLEILGEQIFYISSLIVKVNSTGLTKSQKKQLNSA